MGCQVGIAKKRVGIQGGVEIFLVDSTGQLQINHRGRSFLGRFASIPTAIKVGRELHLRVQVSATDISRQGQGLRSRQPEFVDILGTVLLIEGTNPAPLSPGLRFQFGIARSLGEHLPLPILGRDGVNALIDAWHRALLPGQEASTTEHVPPLARADQQRQGPPPLPKQRAQTNSHFQFSSPTQKSKSQRMAELQDKVAKKLDDAAFVDDNALPFAGFFADSHAQQRAVSQPAIDVSAFAKLPVPPQQRSSAQPLDQ